jgi:hypothetical protein
MHVCPIKQRVSRACEGTRARTAADRSILSKNNTRRLDGERPTRHSRPPLQTAFALGGRCLGCTCHIGAPRPTRSRVTMTGGRFPGSRVVASDHLPRDPEVSSGIYGRWLAAYSCGGSRGIACPMNRSDMRTAFPWLAFAGTTTISVTWRSSSRQRAELPKAKTPRRPARRARLTGLHEAEGTRRPLWVNRVDFGLSRRCLLYPR